MIQANIQIDGEHETANGWLYTLSIEWGDESESPTDHEITMAWVDHEHLAGGTISPSVVIEAVAKIAVDHFGRAHMPARFDLSNLRRRIEGFDSILKSVL